MSTVSKLLSRSSFVGPKIPLLILQGNSLSMLVGACVLRVEELYVYW